MQTNIAKKKTKKKNVILSIVLRFKQRGLRFRWWIQLTVAIKLFIRLKVFFTCKWSEFINSLHVVSAGYTTACENSLLDFWRGQANNTRFAFIGCCEWCNQFVEHAPIFDQSYFRPFKLNKRRTRKITQTSKNQMN